MLLAENLFRIIYWLVQAMKHEFVPPERGFLLENRRFVAQHKVGKHERALVVEVIAVDE